jgi:hypothetical protein
MISKGRQLNFEITFPSTQETKIQKNIPHKQTSMHAQRPPPCTTVSSQ